MNPEIQQLIDDNQQLRARVEALENLMRTHSHTGLDGSGVLDRAKVRSLIFIPNGTGRVPLFDGEFFYHNDGSTQNFRLQMAGYNYTIDLSFL